MDALDIKILREIGKNQSFSPFPSSVASLRRLAQGLGVDKETVRTRLTGLRERGVLVGWHAMINPYAIGLKVSRVWVEFSSEAMKEDGFKKLAQSPNVRVVYDYAGNSASFVSASSMKEPFDTVNETGGGPASVTKSFAATMTFPRADSALNEADWRIYKSIRTNPQKPRRMIAKEVRLGIRTVKRRLGEMSDKNVILVAPNLDPSRIDGVSFDMLVTYKVPVLIGLKGEIATQIGNSLIHVEQFAEPCALFTLVANSVSEAKELRNRVSAIPGVDGLQLYFVLGLIRIRKPLLVSI